MAKEYTSTCVDCDEKFTPDNPCYNCNGIKDDENGKELHCDGQCKRCYDNETEREYAMLDQELDDRPSWDEDIEYPPDTCEDFDNF